METELDFNRDIQIDEKNLDLECLRNATITYRYNEHLRNCKKRLSELHEKLKTVRSELIFKANSRSDIKNAAQLEAYYRRDRKYKRVKQQMIDAQYEVDSAQDAVWAFQTRKSDLENLIKLMSMDYFARPREPKDLPGRAQNMRERATTESRERARNKLSGKRRRRQRQ